jgi:hypothetical protein
MQTFEDILPKLIEGKVDEKFRNDLFKRIIKEESTDNLLSLFNNHPEASCYICPLVLGSFFKDRKFEQILTFLKDSKINESFIFGENRFLDFYTGRIVKYYYFALKHLNKNITQIYNVLASNKEYENKYTIAVATNCILDYQINNNIYEPIGEELLECNAVGAYTTVGSCNDVSMCNVSGEFNLSGEKSCNITGEWGAERARLLFNLGVIYLVKGDCAKSLRLFDQSDILNKNSKLDLLIKKFTIICKLLLGDFSIFYPFMEELKPYFSLIGTIKRGQVKSFYSLLEEQKSEFFSLNLYFVIRRLLKVVAQVGIKKIAICYSRIKLDDISEILGFNVNYLIYKTIKDMEIKGFIQDGIFYSQQEEFYRYQCGNQIKKTIEVRNEVKSLMEYPEILPLNYEKAMNK